MQNNFGNTLKEKYGSTPIWIKPGTIQMVLPSNKFLVLMSPCIKICSSSEDCDFYLDDSIHFKIWIDIGVGSITRAIELKKKLISVGLTVKGTEEIVNISGEDNRIFKYLKHQNVGVKNTDIILTDEESKILDKYAINLAKSLNQ